MSLLKTNKQTICVPIQQKISQGKCNRKMGSKAGTWHQTLWKREIKLQSLSH